MLVRFDHIATFKVNAHHSIMETAEKFCILNCIRRFFVSQGDTAAHRRLGRRCVYRCAGGLRKRGVRSSRRRVVGCSPNGLCFFIRLLAATHEAIETTTQDKYVSHIACRKLSTSSASSLGIFSVDACAPTFRTFRSSSPQVNSGSSIILASRSSLSPVDRL
jgi:hypothetical protein